MGWGMNWLDHDNHRLLDLYIANDSHHSEDANVLYRNMGDEAFSLINAGNPISNKKGS